MPTGYSSIIDEGGKFDEYVWRCARAFGPLISMRDDPLDAPIPDKVESLGSENYHQTQLDLAKETLTKLGDMSEAEVRSAAKADYEQAHKYWKKHKDETDKSRALYFAMRDKVQSWKPPTPEHEGLKTFMLSQIDGGMPYESSTADIPKLLPPDEWKAQKVESAKWDIAYHTKHLAESLEGEQKATAWLNRLRQAVPIPAKMMEEIKKEKKR